MSLSESVAAFREVAAKRGEVWGDELTAVEAWGCQAVRPMISLMADDSADVRDAAVDVIDLWQDDERIVSPLIQALRDPSQSVRAAAASRLGSTGHIRAVEPLIAALTDECMYARKNAASFLGRLGDPEGIGAVARMLGCDPGLRVKSSAAPVFSAIREVCRMLVSKACSRRSAQGS